MRIGRGVAGTISTCLPGLVGSVQTVVMTLVLIIACVGSSNARSNTTNSAVYSHNAGEGVGVPVMQVALPVWMLARSNPREEVLLPMAGRNWKAKTRFLCQTNPGSSSFGRAHRWRSQAVGIRFWVAYVGQHIRVCIVRHRNALRSKKW